MRRRYARRGGFRRRIRGPVISHKQQYSTRINQPYPRPGPRPEGPQQARKATIEDWIPSRAYSDSTTFWFGMFLLMIIALGLFFGMRKRQSPLQY